MLACARICLAETRWRSTDNYTLHGKGRYWVDVDASRRSTERQGIHVRSTVLSLSPGLSRCHRIIFLTGPTGHVHFVRDRLGALAGLHGVGDAAMSLLVLGKDVVAWRSGRAGEAAGGLMGVRVVALRVVEGGKLVV